LNQFTPLKFNLLSKNKQISARNFSVEFLNLKEPSLLKSKKWIFETPFPEDEIITNKNGVLFGLGFRSDSVDKIGPDWPDYLTSLLKNNGYQNIKNSAQKKINKHVTVDSVFHIFHPHMRLYGHFLIEGLYKLFLYSHLLQNFDNVPPLYVSDTSEKFILNWVKELIPEKNILHVTSDMKVLAETFYDFKFHDMYVWSDLTRKLISEYSVNKITKKTDKEYNKIFISRKGVKSSTSFRRLRNASSLELIAIGHGYEVVQPELLDLKEQVALFKNARYVIGEYGSALHNAIFSSSPCTFICFNQINTVQQSIAKNFGHELIFLMPENGFSLNEKNSDGKGIVDYSISEELFNATIGML
jgi:O-antigen biosynthesis protein WbqL